MQNSFSRSFWLPLFGLVYFVQGAALAYFRSFQKPYLSGLGIDADVIGLLTTILLLPFILKIFIGILSDRVSLFRRGHRKPYIVLGLLLAALAFGAAGLVLPDQSFFLFALLVLTGSFSVALFDSTTDGLAIDSTPTEAEGVVQGTMVSGRAAGFIVLSLVFGALVATTGFRVVFFIIGLCMLIPLFWVRRVHEPPEREVTQQFQWSAFRAFRRPVLILFSLFAVLYSFVSFGADGLITFYMSAGFDAPDAALGQYGALRGLGAVVGAVLAGLLMARLGKRWVAFLAAVLVSGCVVVLGLAGSAGFLLVMGLVWGSVWGFQETVFVSLAMTLSDKRIAASMFAIMMALSNFGTALGEGITTGLTDNIGFAAVFFGLALLGLLNLPLLYALFRAGPEINGLPVTEPVPVG